MSHLPESTHQLVNTLYNVTHHTPLVFGWAHWFDLKDVVSWPKDSFLQNITGLLEYDKCYLNTQHQKDMVLKQAKEIVGTEDFTAIYVKASFEACAQRDVKGLYQKAQSGTIEYFTGKDSSFEPPAEDANDWVVNTEELVESIFVQIKFKVNLIHRHTVNI